ncbi:MAG: nucleoside transporter C-terminal domain-containing protein [Deltaproteobacteria bacterium]|nr:nucleoside transporter C-terminal domain-containing protein [Deltaproteobacteria bacterium]
MKQLSLVVALCLCFGLFGLQARADPSDAGVVDAGAAVVVDAPNPLPAAPAEPLPAATVKHEKLKLNAGEIDQTPTGRLRCLFGALAMIAVAFAFSEHRKRIPWKLVAVGSSLQLVFALLVLKSNIGRTIFGVANDAVNAALGFSTAGARFLFGNLVDMSVPVGDTLGNGGAMSVVLDPKYWATTGGFIAFNVLPTILFFSAVMALLYHLGIMQIAVKGIAFVMQKTMGTSGAETMSVASNVFLGQTEAPLLIKPYLEKMTRSELMAVMVAGFATVAGGVMAAYVGMLRESFDDIAGHLLAASVMGAPASLVMAKIMIPETETPETIGGKPVLLPKIDANVLDAVARGTSEGLTLALNVGAMLIAFTAIIAMINALLGLSVDVGLPAVSLEKIFGIVGAPVAFVLGVPWDDAVTVGGLIGTKTVVNEFVAYQQLAGLLHTPGAFHHSTSVVIATYALCGFSNFASIGIQIGGIAAMAPGRRADVAALGIKAMFCGSLATFQTAAIAAMVL